MKLYDNIQNELSKKNINVQVGTMYDMMAIWKSWYRGNVNDFHYYNATLADGSTINRSSVKKWIFSFQCFNLF